MEYQSPSISSSRSTNDHHLDIFTRSPLVWKALQMCSLATIVSMDSSDPYWLTGRPVSVNKYGYQN
eukprot:3869381-Amphidinium_carterae.3